MSRLDKAEDLYLRGFSGEYIERRTGISAQSLRKQLAALGRKYTVADVVAYQISYIRGKYTDDEICDAYRSMSALHGRLYEAACRREVECLGCRFGSFAKVMKALLGDEAYADLRDECWVVKQRATVQRLYGVDNVFRAGSPVQLDEKAVADGRRRRMRTMVERYGVEHPNQHSVIKARMMASRNATNLRKYGSLSPMTSPDVAAKSATRRQDAMLHKYGAANSVQVPEIREKIFESRRRNGTASSSAGEEYLYLLLVDVFGADDVLRNVVVDSRYPYHVDFYIRSRDLFIELNGDVGHNDHWFDENDERDLQTVASWTENMRRVESDTGRASRYRKYISIWTDSDVRKRRAAREHALNYLVFWDGSRRMMKNKTQVPRLRDAREWISAGCPDSRDWRPENTY